MDRSGPNPNESNSPQGRVFELGQNRAEDLGIGPSKRLAREIADYAQRAQHELRTKRLTASEFLDYLRYGAERLRQQGMRDVLEIKGRAGNRPVDISVAHLITSVASIDQQLIWPALCTLGKNNRIAEAERKNIAADMYGYCGEQLETLYLYPNEDLFNYIPRHRVGAIGELTALAILNRKHSSRRITVPGTPTQDVEGVDLVDYVFDDSGLHTRHYQVKTSPWAEFSRPNIMLLNAQDIGNMDSEGNMTFNTTHAILAELRGGQDAAAATAYLDHVEQLPKLRSILNP